VWTGGDAVRGNGGELCVFVDEIGLTIRGGRAAGVNFACVGEVGGEFV